MASPIRFGVDVDGVLYKWEPTVRYLIQRKFGKTLLAADSWDALDNQLTNNEKQWLWTAGVRDGMFRHGSLYRGGIDGLRGLAALGDIYLITSRPAAAKEDTLAWAAYHRLPVSGLTILSAGERKSDFPVDVLIDDGPHNIQDMLDNTDAIAMLWDRPWNQEFRSDSPLFHRVHSWSEVINEFAN